MKVWKCSCELFEDGWCMKYTPIEADALRIFDVFCATTSPSDKRIVVSLKGPFVYHRAVALDGEVDKFSVVE